MLIIGTDHLTFNKEDGLCSPTIQPDFFFTQRRAKMNRIISSLLHEKSDFVYHNFSLKTTVSAYLIFASFRSKQQWNKRNYENLWEERNITLQSRTYSLDHLLKRRVGSSIVDTVLIVLAMIVEAVLSMKAK